MDDFIISNATGQPLKKLKSSDLSAGEKFQLVESNERLLKAISDFMVRSYPNYANHYKRVL